MKENKMFKKRRIIIITTTIIAIVIIFAGLFMLQKFMNHESSQSQRLADLEGRIGLIEEKYNLAESFTGEILWGGVQLFSNWKQYYYTFVS